MAYVPIEAREGVQPIAFAANNQNHSLGTIVRAFDASYGEGEFIYLLGVSGTVTGSVVTWGASQAPERPPNPLGKPHLRPRPQTSGSRSLLQWRRR